MVEPTKYLVESGVFPNEEKAADAICIYNCARKGKVSTPTGEITLGNFPQYLVEKCNVKPKDTAAAIKLLEIDDETKLLKLSRKIELAKRISSKSDVKPY